MTRTKVYTIICDARKGVDKGIHKLVMVDKAKSTEQYWTADDPDMAVKFYSKPAADKTCARLQHNNPQVVDYWDACQLLIQQGKAKARAEGSGNF